MKRHRLDLFALCSGIVFLAVAIGFFLDAVDVWNAQLVWLPPVLLIAIGIVGAVTTLTRPARTRTDEE